MAKSSDRNKVAKVLAEAHRKFDPDITRVVRIVADSETQSDEPVKLLEVNPKTPSSGIVPVGFGADPPEIPYPSVIVEVTEDEFRKIRSGRLRLPSGWRLGDTLYPASA